MTDSTAMRPRGPLGGLRGVCVAAALLTATAGCGSSPATEAALQAAEANGGMDHAAMSAPTALPAAGDLSSSCTRASRGGGAAALGSVELAAQDDQLVLAFTMARPLPRDLAVRIDATPGSTAARGEQPGLSITTTLHRRVPASVLLTTPAGSAEAENAQDLVHVMDRQVHVGVPSSLLDEPGPRWHWSASAVSGRAHALCPAIAGTGGPESVVTVG